MRITQLCALGAASAYFSTIVSARNVPSNIGLPLLPPQSKVVSLSTERRSISNPLLRDQLRRRANTAEAALDNEETLYFVNATIGTPAQSVRLHIDTGSSDLWVNTPQSSLCTQRSDPCAFAGSYVANESSTYEYVGDWFNISYVDGSGASGDYVSDTIRIGSSTLDRLQFGIGYVSSSSQGILGIGYPSNEVQVGRAGRDPYDNLPAALVSAGQISRNAYSLWLNDLDASRGSILFGGIDTEQYMGSLHTLPIQANGGVYSEFLITLTALKLGGETIAENQALAVLLDSGSSLTYLPDEFVETIYERVNAQYDEGAGAAYVPCALENNASTLDFTFSSPTISVEMGELVLDLVTSSGRRPRFTNGEEACLFGIAPAGEGTNVLGDTFLRSAYVVYDIDNNQISLAQTKFNATNSNVREIPAGTDIPGATVVSNSVAATSGVIRGGSGGGASVDSGAAVLTASLSTYVLVLLCLGFTTFATLH
ncbi:aspartic-type endopeptidase [Xylaria bambusicola]|uniref:aspartic-type endopeptidase n=1 Tax=Xylaria bambusicola TaxID=326684 RepID=UPI00200892FC|nr:aspartic-type endopeptidase [Xylaria bambusicola]KAI0526577.1 aspartic-type endopeptidase [Xylaria bambusicola]